MAEGQGKALEQLKLTQDTQVMACLHCEIPPSFSLSSSNEV